MLRQTIKFNLIVTYSLIILVPFLILSAYLITTESQKINSRTYQALRQNCVSLNNSLEKEIKQMNIVSLNLAYSFLIRDAYNEYLSNQNDYENLKALNELIANSIGPNRLVDQANLYSILGTVIASGLHNGTYFAPAEQMPWYEAAENNDGSRVLSYEGTDPFISRYTTDEYGKVFLSLSRKYYDKYNNVQGYIEVKKSVRQIFSQVISYNSISDEKIIVFDGFGQTIFSSNMSEDFCQAVYEQIVLSDPAIEFISFSDNKTSHAVTFARSEDGVLTAIVIDENSLFMPTRSYMWSVIFLALISLVLAFILSFFAANRITVPIKHIYHEMQQINLDGYLQKNDLHTRTIELNVLYDKFIDMQHKLVDSMNKQLLLKNQEMQSKMIAL